MILHFMVVFIISFVTPFMNSIKLINLSIQMHYSCFLSYLQSRNNKINTKKDATKVQCNKAYVRWLIYAEMIYWSNKHGKL